MIKTSLLLILCIEIISGQMKLKFLESENIYVNVSRTVSIQLESQTYPDVNVIWFYVSMDGSEELKLGKRRFRKVNEGIFIAEMQLEYIDKPKFLGEDFYVGARLNESIEVLSNFTAILPAPWHIKFKNRPVLGENVTISCTIPNGETNDIILKRVKNPIEREGIITISNNVCLITMFFNWYKMLCEYDDNRNLVVSITIPASETTPSLNNSFWRIGKFYGRDTSKYIELLLAVVVTEPSIRVLNSSMHREGEVIHLECRTLPNATSPVQYSWYIEGNSTVDHAATINITLQKSLYHKAVRCEVSNLDRPPVSSTPYVLEFFHTPYNDFGIEGIQMSTPIIESHDPQEVKCVVHGGYPRPSLEFSCKDGEIESHGGHNETAAWKSITITLERSFNDVMCFCNATQEKSNFSRNESFKFTILFPPSVMVNNVEEKEGRNVTLKCELHGNPTEYEIKWKHCVGDTIVRGNVELQKFASQDKRELYLKSVIQDDSGTYVCSANNGIRDIRNNIWQINFGTLTVKGWPIYVQVKRIFYGFPGENVTISVPLFAYPKVKLQQVQLRKLQETSRMSENASTIIELHDATIGTSSYGQTVQRPGQRILMKIIHFRLEYTGNYYIMLTYEGNKRTLFSFEIRANVTTPSVTLGASVYEHPFPWALMSCFLFFVFLGVMLHRLLRRKRCVQRNSDLYINDSVGAMQINLGSIAEWSHVWRRNTAFRYSSVRKSVETEDYEHMDTVPKPVTSCF